MDIEIIKRLNNASNDNGEIPYSKKIEESIVSLGLLYKKSSETVTIKKIPVVQYSVNIYYNCKWSMYV